MTKREASTGTTHEFTHDVAVGGYGSNHYGRVSEVRYWGYQPYNSPCPAEADAWVEWARPANIDRLTFTDIVCHSSVYSGGHGITSDGWFQPSRVWEAQEALEIDIGDHTRSGKDDSLRLSVERLWAWQIAWLEDSDFKDLSASVTVEGLSLEVRTPTPVWALCSGAVRKCIAYQCGDDYVGFRGHLDMKPEESESAALGRFAAVHFGEASEPDVDVPFSGRERAKAPGGIVAAVPETVRVDHAVFQRVTIDDSLLRARYAFGPIPEALRSSLMSAVADLQNSKRFARRGCGVFVPYQWPNGSDRLLIALRCQQESPLILYGSTNGGSFHFTVSSSPPPTFVRTLAARLRRSRGQFWAITQAN